MTAIGTLYPCIETSRTLQTRYSDLLLLQANLFSINTTPWANNSFNFLLFCNPLVNAAIHLFCDDNDEVNEIVLWMITGLKGNCNKEGFEEWSVNAGKKMCINSLEMLKVVSFSTLFQWEIIQLCYEISI